jgi:hypothetical protein
VLGFVTSSLSLELLKDDAPLDTTPPLIAYSLTGGRLTNIAKTLVAITDASPTVTSVWINGTAVVVNSDSKAIPITLNEGVNTVLIRSKDAYDNESPDLIANDIRLDTVPARITSDVATSFIVAFLPYQKMISFTSNEELAFHVQSHFR